ncbi:MAG: hypothetical protein ACPGU6_01905 [Tenacibaculum sp.]
MKKNIFLLSLLSLALYNCDKDRCDEGYKPYDANGHEICVPEFVTGQRYNFELGDAYLHPKHGLITIENGVWKNENNQTISIQ